MKEILSFYKDIEDARLQTKSSVCSVRQGNLLGEAGEILEYFVSFAFEKTNIMSRLRNLGMTELRHRI